MQLDADEFRDLLYEAYPKLKHGGGFQFFKCAPNSRRLEPLSSATLSSPSMLKSRVGNARTYIRPLQRDLDMSVVADLPEGVSYCVCIHVVQWLKPVSLVFSFAAKREMFAVQCTF